MRKDMRVTRICSLHEQPQIIDKTLQIHNCDVCNKDSARYVVFAYCELDCGGGDLHVFLCDACANIQLVKHRICDKPVNKKIFAFS
jgi:hypothetical protein